MRQSKPYFQKMILEPPITFSELISKIIVTEETPNSIIKELETYKLNCETQLSKRLWEPNLNVEGYQRRRERKRRERELS